MLYHLAVAFGGICVLIAGWVAVQALKRRSDPRYGPGDDVLAGCGTCSLEDVCHGGADGRPDGCAIDGAARLAAKK